MELNGVNSVPERNYGVNSTYSKTADAVDAKLTEIKATDDAAIYEQAEEQRTTTYNPHKKVDQSTIDQLKADAEARFSQLQDLVNKLITKQAETDQTAATVKYGSLGDIMKAVKDGEIAVDPEDIKQAQEDVAEGGYWSVEETAKRLVDFAKAISGDDTSKAEELRAAIDKGFGAAEKTWGSKLPEISEKTHDRVNELLDDWLTN